MAKKKRAKPKPSTDGATGRKRIPFTVKLDPETLELARRAAFWTPGLTVTGLVEAATLREIRRLEKKRGEPFPAMTGPLRTGRPVGA